MAKRFRVKERNGFWDDRTEFFCKLFKRKPRVKSLNGRAKEESGIFIGVNEGGGPFCFRKFLDKRFMTWAPHPMYEGFLSRRRFLYHTIYRQRLNYGKFRAFWRAFFGGIFLGRMSSYAGILPVYYDSEIYSTYKYSMDCLSKGVSLFVFAKGIASGFDSRAQDSENERIWPDFVRFSRVYFKKKGVDLPIYSVFYSKKARRMVIGRPMYVNRLLQSRNEDEVLDVFCNYFKGLKGVAFGDNEAVNEFFVEGEAAVVVGGDLPTESENEL